MNLCCCSEATIYTGLCAATGAGAKIVMSWPGGETTLFHQYPWPPPPPGGWMYKSAILPNPGFFAGVGLCGYYQIVGGVQCEGLTVDFFGFMYYYTFPTGPAEPGYASDVCSNSANNFNYYLNAFSISGSVEVSKASGYDASMIPCVFSEGSTSYTFYSFDGVLSL